jgi:hypothetical protein
MKKALGIHTNLGRDDCDDDHGGRADRGKTDRVRKRAPPSLRPIGRRKRNHHVNLGVERNEHGTH